MDLSELFKIIINEDYQRIHVIEMDSFDMVYANKISTEKSYTPNSSYSGKKCYEYYFGKDEQCEVCPLRNANSANTVIEKQIGDRQELVHTRIADVNGKKYFIEYVEDITDIKSALVDKKNNLEVISALSSDYLNVYLIDKASASARIIKLDGYVTVGMDKNSDKVYDYTTAALAYINNRVYSEDINKVKEEISFDRIISELQEKDIYQGVYRVLDEGEIKYYQYKYIKIGNSDNIVTGFSNVDDIVKKDIRHKDEIKKKNEELIQTRHDRDAQFEVLKSMSEIYYSMHYIDLLNNTTVEYSSSEVLRPYVNRTTDASAQLYDAMKHRVTGEQVENILEFVNLDTLPERLKKKKIISRDFLNIDNIWLRASFIKIESDSKGYPLGVIYTTQVVDEERRREEELLFKSYTDVLTRCQNRRAFERDVEKYRNTGLPKDFYCIILDVNRLKYVNDTKGHAAGDELILEAVACMQQCFGQYGKVYRVGGDEFAVVLSVKQKEMENIIEDFDQVVASGKGERLQDFSVAYGIACSNEFEDANLDKLLEIADSRMYENKNHFYMINNIDRRKNRTSK